MDDLVLRWVSTLGFPIFAACSLAWALLKIFAKYEESANEAKQIALKLHDQAITQVSTVNATLEKTAIALEKNAKATDSNTEYLKKFGSDLMGLCKAKDAIVSSGLVCPSDDKLELILSNISKLKGT